MAKSQLQELERIIDQTQHALFRAAYFRTGSLDDAQDIVQDVFLKLWNDIDHLSKVENIKGYLFRSVYNHCSDYGRKKRRSSIVPLGETLAEELLDEDQSELHAEYERIDRLLGALPPEQAGIIRMKTVDNLTFVEIARILDIPLTTAKSRFKYGIDHLRKNF